MRPATNPSKSLVVMAGTTATMRFREEPTNAMTTVVSNTLTPLAGPQPYQSDPPSQRQRQPRCNTASSPMVKTPTLTLRLATPTPSSFRRSRATLTLRLGTPTQSILDASSTATLTLTLSAAAVPTAAPEATTLPFSAPASGGYAEREDQVSVSGLAAGGNHRRLLVFRAAGSPL